MMSLIILKRGNLLDSAANLLVCPVNCEPGVMGAGLAKEFADRYDFLRGWHHDVCARGNLKVGVVTAHQVDLANDRWVVFFPTKDRWRERSQPEWIFWGLANLSRLISQREIEHSGQMSVALPALGCGLGGLAWEGCVDRMVLGLVAAHPRTHFTVYRPDAERP